MRLGIWSTTTPRENSTHTEMFRRQLEEVELAERIGVDQIWFFEHHLQPTAPVPSPNLLIAAAARTTQRIRFASMVNILPFRHPLLVAEEAAMLRREGVNFLQGYYYGTPSIERPSFVVFACSAIFAVFSATNFGKATERCVGYTSTWNVGYFCSSALVPSTWTYFSACGFSPSRSRIVGAICVVSTEVLTVFPPSTLPPPCSAAWWSAPG